MPGILESPGDLVSKGGELSLGDNDLFSLAKWELQGVIASCEYFQGARADADRITKRHRLVMNKFRLEI